MSSPMRGWYGSAAMRASAASCCSMPLTGDRSAWRRAPMRYSEANGEEREANNAGQGYYLLPFRYFASLRGCSMVQKSVRKFAIALAVIVSAALGGTAAALALGAE